MQKKHILLTFCFAFFLFFIKVQAQQIPLLGQQTLNPYSYNPAFAGNESYGSAFLSHRRQWIGIEGAPATTLFTLNMPFYEDRNGLGLTIQRDEVNILERHKVMASYAFHLFQNREGTSRLSFGLSAGAHFQNINQSKVKALHLTDPRVFNTTQNNFVVAQVEFGMNYQYDDKLQIGFALPQMLHTNFDFFGEPKAVADRKSIDLIRHYIVNAQYRYENRRGTMALVPAVLVRKADWLPVQVDATLRYEKPGAFWIGGGYRQDYAAIGFLGFNANQLKIGYCYEHALGTAGNAGFGTTHELTLGFMFSPLMDDGLGRHRHWQKRRKKKHPSRRGPIQFKRR